MIRNLIAWFALISCVSAQNTGNFWHVTDFHYDPSYKTTGESCKNRTDTSTLGRYGNYMCDSPWLLITEAVEAMKIIEPNVDFVVWTGDDTPHVDNDQLGEDLVVSIITNLTTLLRDTFQETPVYAALGNHDYHPKNQMPPHSNYLYRSVWEQWRLWVNDSQSNATFNKGGYYTTVPSPGLRIVVLNTVLYYKSNKVTPGLDDPADQFKWLDDVMTASAKANEKVYIVTHIPPGVFEKHVGWPWMPDKFNDRLESLIVKHASTIAGVFYGHHHTDALRMFYDVEGKAVATGLIAPAVTPWKTTLPNGIGSLSNNPGIRLIKYDTDNFVIQDVCQYFLNLTAANLAGDKRPVWELEYNATSAYGIPDLTPASVDKLVKSFLDDGSVMFQKYIDHNSVSFMPGESCTGSCKAAQYCAATKVGREAYTDCYSQMTSKPTTPKPTISRSWTINTRCWANVVLPFTLFAILSVLNF